MFILCLFLAVWKARWIGIGAMNSRCLLTVMSLLGVQQALARLTGEWG